MKTITVGILVVFLAVCVVVVRPWNLRPFGIGPDYFASSIAVYKNRAFLSLPRSSCHNNLTNPTLIEVPWGGATTSTWKRDVSFPNGRTQVWGNCKHLQDAISLDVESWKARLWVLDRGSKKCPPKIVIYNLVYNVEMLRVGLSGVEGKELGSLVVDLGGQFSPRAYIGGAGSDYLIMFSLRDFKWTKFHLRDSSGRVIPISKPKLAMSTIYPVLFVAPENDDELFGLNLTRLQLAEEPQLLLELEGGYNATSLGHVLGKSSGMACDKKGGLDYYMLNDYAVVRWDTSEPPQAEFHNVLAQSYELLPYVPHLFNGPQNDLWALVNPLPPQECFTPSERRQHLASVKNAPAISKRVVRLLKYVKN